jgi:hypothetical protein
MSIQHVTGGVAFDAKKIVKWPCGTSNNEIVVPNMSWVKFHVREKNGY